MFAYVANHGAFLRALIDKDVDFPWTPALSLGSLIGNASRKRAWTKMAIAGQSG